MDFSDKMAAKKKVAVKKMDICPNKSVVVFFFNTIAN